LDAMSRYLLQCGRRYHVAKAARQVATVGCFGVRKVLDGAQATLNALNVIGRGDAEVADDSSPLGERVIYRVPIRASWLGERPEFILTDRCVLLHDRLSGAMANLPLEDIQTVREAGSELHIRRIPRNSWVDFAGNIFNGWYIVSSADDWTSTEMANRVRRASLGFGHQAMGTRIRQALCVLRMELNDPWRHLL